MKTTRHLTLTFAVLLACGTAYSQQPSPNSTPPANDDVVKISTSLIQLDVLVTDKEGKAVPGLRPEDFKVYQDGQLQKITSLVYIDSQTSERTRILTRDGKPDKKAVPPPSVPARAAKGRIITFVLDDGDCTLAFGDMNMMVDTMKKFVNEQMLPDDRVAIYRSAGGASLLPVYTSNKAVLLKEIGRVHPYMGIGCPTAFDPATNNTTLKGTDIETQRDRDTKARGDATEKAFNLRGNLFVLNAAIERLKNLPERKILFLFSEGIELLDRSGPGNNLRADLDTVDAIRDIVDKATRASVIVNTVSVSGLTIPGMLEAVDDPAPGRTSDTSAARIEAEGLRQGGMALLANSTGGSFIHNSNFPNVQKVIDKQSAYYLIGYEPDDDTFKGKEFHKIEVKVERPDLHVASRNGFIGRSDTETRPVYRTADSPLYQAMDSPLATGGIDIGLTIISGNDPQRGDFVRPLFRVGGSDLTFVDEANGGKKVVLDVAAVILSDKGKLVDEFNRTYTTHIPKEAYPLARQNGVDFSTDLPVKKPGLYSLRVAVRDAASKRLGSAADYFETTDLKKGSFAVAGLVTSDAEAGGLPRARPADSAFSLIPSTAAPSIRKYRKGSVMLYSYTVYNARTDALGGMPNLTQQLRLFHNAKLVLEVPETPYEPLVPSDPLRIVHSGTIRITDQVEAGDYVLQIIVRDKLRNKLSSQSIDFEVTD